MNLSGFEQGGTYPGVARTDYIPPSTELLDRALSWGILKIRLPFRWERIQPTLMGALDPAHLALLDAFIAHAHANGQSVMLDMHNYGGRVVSGVEYKMGSATVPIVAVVDGWTKIAQHYSGMPGVERYEICNEPHDMPLGSDGVDTNWFDIAQAVINGIGAVDPATPIDVDGHQYAGTWEWPAQNPRLHLLTSLGNPIRYQGHGYPDFNNSGTLLD